MAKKIPSINNREAELNKLLARLKANFAEHEQVARPWHEKFKALRELFEGKVDDYYQRGDDDEQEGGKKQLFRSMAISQMVRAAVGIIEGTTLRPYVATDMAANEMFADISDVSTALLKTWFEGGDVRDELDECIVDYCLNGTCVAANPWNPKLGGKGDPDLWHVKLINTYPQPGYKKFGRMNRFYFTKEIDQTEVREKYGKEIEGLMDRIGGNKSDTLEVGDENKPDKYKATIAYEKKDGKWTCVVYSDKVVLEHKGEGADEPFPYEKLPYFHARCNVYPGEFWGKGIGEDIESIERILDKLFQQIIANQQDVGSTNVWYDPSGLPTDFEPTDMPGVAIPMKPGRDPRMQIHYKGAVDTMGGAGTLAAILNARLVDITGIHSPAVGKRGRANESGEAIKLLQGGTNQTFAPSVVRWIRFIRRISENTLGLMYKNYTGARMIKMVGPEGNAILKAIGKDFPENFRPIFDIDIQDDSKLPKDPASRAELASKGIEFGATDAKYWREQMGINDPALEQRVDQLQQMGQQMGQMQQAMNQMQQQTQQAEAQVKNLETQLQRATMANAEGRVNVMMNKQEVRNEKFEAGVTKQRLQVESSLIKMQTVLKQIMSEVKLAKQVASNKTE